MSVQLGVLIIDCPVCGKPRELGVAMANPEGPQPRAIALTGTWKAHVCLTDRRRIVIEGVTYEMIVS